MEMYLQSGDIPLTVEIDSSFGKRKYSVSSCKVPRGGFGTFLVVYEDKNLNQNVQIGMRHHLAFGP